MRYVDRYGRVVAVCFKGNERRLVSRIRADYASFAISAKLCIIIDDFTHQFFNDLLPDRAVLAKS